MMKKELIIDNLNRIINKKLIVNPLLLSILGIMTFSILTALGAFIHIPLPFTPVPITLQTFFVLLSGLILGQRDAAFSQIAYFLLGGLGVPIFAVAGIGLMSVTTGYLIGFIFAAWIVGKLTIENKSLLWLTFVLIIASALILVFGSVWLIVFLDISLSQSLFLGMFPFIIGDVVKIFLVLLVYKNLFN